MIEDSNGATVLLENVTITTSFEKYNFTTGTQFIFGSGVGRYGLTILVPSNLALGTYNLTLHVTSWKYLDTQAGEWISLRPDSVNETLLVTDNPPGPQNGPGPNSSNSGQPPSSSKSRTTISPVSLLALFRSIIIPAIGSYVALGVLAVALLVRQNRKLSVSYTRFLSRQIVTANMQSSRR